MRDPIVAWILLGTVAAMVVACVAWAPQDNEVVDELVVSLRRLRRALAWRRAPAPAPAPAAPRSSSRALVQRREGDVERIGVTCAASGLGRLRLRVGRADAPWLERGPAERCLRPRRLHGRFDVLAADPQRADTLALVSALEGPLLERLLPRSARRWLELRPGEVVLVRPGEALPLDDRLAEVHAQLAALALALELASGDARALVLGTRGPTRCAFCHDDLTAGRADHTCPGCATRLHPECRSELLACPTPGCGRRAA